MDTKTDLIKYSRTRRFYTNHLVSVHNIIYKYIIREDDTNLVYYKHFFQKSISTSSYFVFGAYNNIIILCYIKIQLISLVYACNHIVDCSTGARGEVLVWMWSEIA